MIEVVKLNNSCAFSVILLTNKQTVKQTLANAAFGGGQSWISCGYAGVRLDVAPIVKLLTGLNYELVADKDVVGFRNLPQMAHISVWSQQ